MRVTTLLLGAAVLVAAGPQASAIADGFWGGFMPRASTAAEGAARGTADVVRSAGLANLFNSAAARNREAARSEAIDNRLKGTKTHFEMRRVNRAYRDANRRPRPTSEQLHRLAREATPKPLTRDQLDPVRGRITWPALLRTDYFREHRETLDTLYAERARASGQLEWDQFTAIRESIGQMQETLRDKLPDVPPQVFTQSNAFLKQLQHTAQL